MFRENMTQINDTPRRQAFMRRVAEKGWLGLTWPEEYGGQNGEGVYEYLLNEALAGVGAPQIGKGVGIIGKTLIRHGSEKLKREFLPKILKSEVEFAVGYSEPQAGSDAASMQLEALRDGDGWRLNGQKMWTTSAHFADWYWVGARTKKEDKHGGITLFLIPMDHPGLEVQGPADDRRRDHQRGLLQRRVGERRVPGRRFEQGLRLHRRGARPGALHDVHVLADPPADSSCCASTCAGRRATASRSRTTRRCAPRSPAR